MDSVVGQHPGNLEDRPETELLLSEESCNSLTEHGLHNPGMEPADGASNLFCGSESTTRPDVGLAAANLEATESASDRRCQSLVSRDPSAHAVVSAEFRSRRQACHVPGPQPNGMATRPHSRSVALGRNSGNPSRAARDQNHSKRSSWDCEPSTSSLVGSDYGAVSDVSANACAECSPSLQGAKGTRELVLCAPRVEDQTGGDFCNCDASSGPTTTIRLAGDGARGDCDTRSCVMERGVTEPHSHFPAPCLEEEPGDANSKGTALSSWAGATNQAGGYWPCGIGKGRVTEGNSFPDALSIDSTERDSVGIRLMEMEAAPEDAEGATGDISGWAMEAGAVSVQRRVVCSCRRKEGTFSAQGDEKSLSAFTFGHHSGLSASSGGRLAPSGQDPASLPWRQDNKSQFELSREPSLAAQQAERDSLLTDFRLSSTGRENNSALAGMEESSFINESSRDAAHNLHFSPRAPGPRSAGCWSHERHDCPFCGDDDAQGWNIKDDSHRSSADDAVKTCDQGDWDISALKAIDHSLEPRNQGEDSQDAVANDAFSIAAKSPLQAAFENLRHGLDFDRQAKKKLRECAGAGSAQCSSDEHEFERPTEGSCSQVAVETNAEQSDGEQENNKTELMDSSSKDATATVEDEVSAGKSNGESCDCEHRVKQRAPPLGEPWLYHVFFLYHHCDHPWVLGLARQLGASKLGFKCCCLWNDMDGRSSVTQMTSFGLERSRKAIVVMSPDFMNEVWCGSEPQILSELDVIRRRSDMIVVDRFSCDLPHMLAGLTYIDARRSDWWERLLKEITYQEEPLSADQRTHISITVGPNAGLHSGYLLTSLKSRYLCCGKEVVDPTKVPGDLNAYGVQISDEDYRRAVTGLMSDPKFRCHVWCYNVPAAIACFMLLLGVCLALIPLVESQLILRARETGMEYVHGGIVWLCLLTIYLCAMHISKKRMKKSTYGRLTEMNGVLSKYNLLAGVENLGMADCNKYYLHIFYFDMGPCMAYLQELILGMDETPSSMEINMTAPNQSSNHANDQSRTESVAVETDHVIVGSDQSHVLEATGMTNVAMQVGAEDLLLASSGEYLSLLITKKLAHPQRPRHVYNSACLCQYVEQTVFKMSV